jgi:hypothetical protein
MYARISRLPQLAATARRQSGVIHRGQFGDCGVSGSTVTANLRAQRWLGVGAKVVLLQNAPPTRRQVMWIAVLDAGCCALGSHTSLELAGFRGFASEAAAIHLVVRRGDKPTLLPGVVVHESRRFWPEQVVFTDGLPRTPTARSVLDAASWQPHPRFAATMVAATIQRRLVTAADLDDAMRTVGRIRHKQYLREAIADAADGAHALGELDLARMCRAFGIAAPARQIWRKDAGGAWRFLDAEWRTTDGEMLVLEVDGSFHMDAEHWQADMRRERSVVVGRKRVLRASNFEVRHEPALLVHDLLALGVPRLPELSEPHDAMAS